MFRAGLPHEVALSTGEWLFVDLGFSRIARSCGIAFGGNQPEAVTFAEMVEEVVSACTSPGGPLCLLLEAPLSVAFSSDGNPTGRRPERNGSKHRYWYSGLGASVLTSATYLLRAIADSPPKRDIILFEGFASFKPRGTPSSHVGDVARLRDVVWDPAAHQGAVLGPDALAANPTDRLMSAFAVAGMDYGLPTVVHIDAALSRYPPVHAP